MLEYLPAMGTLDLVFGGTVSQTGYSEDGVVILRLYRIRPTISGCEYEVAYLPVLGLALKHNGVFRLVNVIWVLILDLLDVGLCLDALILRECALMTLLNTNFR
jgi:hypothetical protein